MAVALPRRRPGFRYALPGLPPTSLEALPLLLFALPSPHIAHAPKLYVPPLAKKAPSESFSWFGASKKSASTAALHTYPAAFRAHLGASPANAGTFRAYLCVGFGMRNRFLCQRQRAKRRTERRVRHASPARTQLIHFMRRPWL